MQRINHRKLKIVFMGTPDFAAEILKGLNASGYEVAAAVSQPDKPVGRHSVLMPTAVHAAADALGIPVIQPQKASDPVFIEEIKTLSPDVIVVAAYGKILRPELLNIPRYGCINVHASLLPRWRGAAPIQWSIIAGDSVTGVTTMQMAEGLDTGDILLRESVDIAEDETGGSLFDKLAVTGSGLIIRTLELLQTGELCPIRQNDDEATYAPMLKKNMGNIDWKSSAEEIERLSRGLSPWPGTFTYSEGRMIKLHAVRVHEIDGSHIDTAGRVSTESGHIYVDCGNGRIEILNLQLEGKKALSAADFLRGSSLSGFNRGQEE